MIGRAQWMRTSAAWGAALWLVGCGQDAPPYDDLPLRDALRASPEVVASLSFDTRRELALRLDAAGSEEDDAANLGWPETVTIDALARVADDAREEQGQDALIVGEIISQADDFVLRGEDIDEDALGRVIVGPIYLRGRPGAETAPLEDVALRGRAGKWLRELSGRTKTEKMVRTTGVPFGAWAFEKTLYVNASWLVAMSALEEDAAVAPVNTGSAAVTEPKKNPLSVDYNPYNLPGTIAECVVQVETTCACGTSCTHEVTDPSFPSAVEECAWVNSDSTHPAALCVLALMSIDDVRACMHSAGQCSALPVTTGDDALAFVQDSTCMELLDVCLRDGTIPRQSSGGSSSNSCNNGSNCGGCSNSNSGSSCSDDCSKCNNDWSQCNDNCEDCNNNCANTSSNAKSCGKCTVRPASDSAPSQQPWGTAFWLFAPVAYVLLRGRRRS